MAQAFLLKKIPRCLNWWKTDLEKPNILYLFKNFKKYRDVSSTKALSLSKTAQATLLYFNYLSIHINYGIISWGNASMSNLKKIQVKQNHIVRLIFHATLCGKHTESALPFLNPLD